MKQKTAVTILSVYLLSIVFVAIAGTFFNIYGDKSIG